MLKKSSKKVDQVPHSEQKRTDKKPRRLQAKRYEIYLESKDIWGCLNKLLGLSHLLLLLCFSTCTRPVCFTSRTSFRSSRSSAGVVSLS